MAGHADFQPLAQCSCTNGTSAGACGDRTVLTALLAGQLSSAEHARLEAHVSHCPLCQARLKELDESPAEAGTAVFLNALRHVAAEYQAEDAPTFHQVVEQLKAGRIRSQSCPMAHDDDQLVNATIGDYRIVREVGHGGMGVVYEAEQLSLRRRVALKTLPFASLLDERRLTRFQNEARMAAHLEHPHIVPVYAVGVERGIHFYAMRYVNGPNLAQILREVRARSPRSGTGLPQAEAKTNSFWTTAEHSPCEVSNASGSWTASLLDARPTDVAYQRAVVSLILTAAEAVEHAHSQGIVHRDIKPSNLMLDTAGHLWVADFGLARIATEGSVSASGALLGTIPYMSPEQASVGNGVLDQRTDVYSLGATLYELLTLIPPFGNGPVPKLLSRIATEEPPPPRRHNPRIPRDLETIILKSLAKEPGDRYPTAQALADDLRRFLEAKPIRASRPRVADRLARVVRKHPSAIAATGIVLLLLAGLSGLLAVAVGERAQLNTQLQTSLSHQVQLNQQLHDSVAETENYAVSLQEQVYAADMTLAAESYRNGDFASAMELLSRQRPQPGQPQPDVRSVDWNWLYSRVQAKGGTIAVSMLPLHVVTISPDQTIIAVAGADSVLRLLDAKTWQSIREWPTEQKEINDIAFSGDSQRIASTGDDGTLCLWEVETRKQLFRVNAYSRYAREVIFSNDGRELITSGSDETNVKLVRVWDAAQGTHVREFAGPWSGIDSLAISPDEQTISVGSFNAIYLIDADDGTLRRTLEGHEGRVTAQAFVPGAAQLITGGIDRTVRSWDLNDGTDRLIGRHLEGIETLACLPDGRHVAAGDRSGMLRIWDHYSPRAADQETMNDDLLADVRWDVAAEGDVRWCGMTADGRTLLAATNTQLLSRDVATGMEHEIPFLDSAVLASRPADPGALQIGDVSPDGRMFTLLNASYREDRQSATGWTFQSQIQRSADSIHSVCYSPDGQRIALGNELGRVWIHDALTGEPITTLEEVADIASAERDPHPDDWVTTLRFSTAGHWLAAKSGRHTPSQINVWDVQTGKLQFSPVAPELPIVRSLAFSPDQQQLVSCALDMKIRFWSMSTRHQLTDWPVHNPSNGLSAIDISPDGRWLASSDLSSTPRLRLWDLRSGEVLWSANQKYGYVRFQSKGRKLIAGGYGATLRVWDVPRIVAAQSARRSPDGPNDPRRWPPAILAHEARVMSIAVSVDGNRLLSVGRDGQLRVSTPQAADWQPERLLPEPDVRIDGLTSTPTGTLLLWQDDRTAWLLAPHAATARPMPLPSLAVRAAAISSDGRRVAFIDYAGLVGIKHTDDLDVVRTFTIPLEAGESVDWCGFLPNGSELAVRVNASEDRLRVFDVNTGQRQARYPQTLASHVRVAESGALVFSSARDLCVWNSAGELNPRSLTGHREAVTALALSSDGRSAASAGGERSIVLWDLVTLRSWKVMFGHTAPITALAFSPDNGTLVSADQYGVMKLWHVTTGRQLLELPQSPRESAQLLFVSNPLRLLSRFPDGSVIVFPFDLPQERATSDGSPPVEAAGFTGQRPGSAQNEVPR